MREDERIARSRIEAVEGRVEGWVCALDDEWADDGPLTAEYIILYEDGSGYPVCQWHADEYVHDHIEYGNNCSECGIQHDPLFPEKVRSD
jgi:hypothetical protein